MLPITYSYIVVNSGFVHINGFLTQKIYFDFFFKQRNKSKNYNI